MLLVQIFETACPDFRDDDPANATGAGVAVYARQRKNVCAIGSAM